MFLGGFEKDEKDLEFEKYEKVDEKVYPNIARWVKYMRHTSQ